MFITIKEGPVIIESIGSEGKHTHTLLRGTQ